MPLTEAQKAYIAGIVDGEGSIMLQRSMARASSGYLFPVIKVANTNKLLIEWLLLITGAGAIQYISRMNIRCKNVYHWTIASNEAISLLEDIRPYLLLKITQADACLALWAENKAAVDQTGRKAFGRGNPIPRWLRHFREALFFYVRDLNRRGITADSFSDEVRYHLAACRFEELKCR